ncbi:uncharacterized protein LOC111344167 [Stylophora pistillata]|uniref:uncharacterized protein LOC111344167 n=1 Tax=Stylophora pistillata TaxID=50429 RepID=UPI000C03D345|nr:uncharacterized protein LOC111344167 [Stylophora pistillata]
MSQNFTGESGKLYRNTTKILHPHQGKTITSPLSVYQICRRISASASDSLWHHICVSWEGNSGSWKFYIDGDMKDQGTNLGKGRVINPGGILMLGQEQDSFGGEISHSQSLQGMLSNVNIWNVSLSSKQVREMSQMCLLDEAPNDRVLQWLDFVNGARKGGVRLVKTSPCKIEKTCRCPKKIYVNWVKLPQLCVTQSTEKSKVPGGLFPKLVCDMIRHVCGTCHQHKRTEIIFNQVNGSFEDMTGVHNEHIHLNMPITILPQVPISGEGWRLLPVVEVPGFALVTRKPSVNTFAVILQSSVLSCWPLFAMMLTMQFMFGLAVWVVVSKVFALFIPRSPW